MYDDPMQIDIQFRFPTGLGEGDTVRVGFETFTVVAVNALDRAYVTLVDAHGRKREAVIRSDGGGRDLLVWR